MRNLSRKQQLTNSSTLITNQQLNYHDLAQFLGISPATLRIWVMRKMIPYYKIGKLVRFSPEKIQEWLNSHSVDTEVK